MSKKLFALESDVAEEPVVLETDAEVGEVADVEVDVVEDAAEIQEEANSIDEGLEASAQLEEVEEVVGKAAEGEGLDEGQALGADAGKF